MCSLDVNADIILKHGDELFKTWMNNLTFFYEKVSEIDGISVVRNNMLDFSKINLDALPLGYDGYELEKHLTDAGIFPELTAGNLVMCMTGIGNDRSDFERLLDALGTLESRSKSKYTSDREIPTSEKFLEKGTFKPESYLGKGITKSVISLNKETAGRKTKNLGSTLAYVRQKSRSRTRSWLNPVSKARFRRSFQLAQSKLWKLIFRGK